MHGPRKPVSLGIDQISETHITAAAEKLINFLSDNGTHFEVLEDKNVKYDQQIFHAPAEPYEGIRIDTYKALLERYKDFKKEIPQEISLEQFQKEWETSQSFDQLLKAYPFTTIRGSKMNSDRMLHFISKIIAHPLGKKLFEDMKACNKTLLIYDDKHALSGGGYTAAVETTSDIFKPGKGAKAYIRFRFDQPTNGAHIVQSDHGTIPFTYLDNIFHELVHAKHIMCGTMSFSGAEAQAIAEENEFRRQRPETSHWSPRDPGGYEDGEQTWFGLRLQK